MKFCMLYYNENKMLNFKTQYGGRTQYCKKNK